MEYLYLNDEYILVEGDEYNLTGAGWVKLTSNFFLDKSVKIIRGFWPNLKVRRLIKETPLII